MERDHSSVWVAVHFSFCPEGGRAADQPFWWRWWWLWDQLADWQKFPGLSSLPYYKTHCLTQFTSAVPGINLTCMRILLCRYQWWQWMRCTVICQWWNEIATGTTPTPDPPTLLPLSSSCASPPSRDQLLTWRKCHHVGWECLIGEGERIANVQVQHLSYAPYVWCFKDHEM